MKFLAHTENANGITHLLRDHLQSVGDLARHFADKGNPALSEAAYWAGRLHDLGKYRGEFQDYLLKKRESSSETHHAVYGAALALQRESYGLAFAIAGHHAGLHDQGELENLLLGRNTRQNGAFRPCWRTSSRNLEKFRNISPIRNSSKAARTRSSFTSAWCSRC